MLYDIACKKKEEKPFRLTKNGKYIINFNENIETEYNYKIRIRGEVDVPLYNRTEEKYPLYYRSLKDSLKEKDGNKVLVINKNNECYERSAYLMIRGEFPIDEKLDFSFNAISNLERGNFTLSLEVYYGKSHTRYYYDKPDETHSFSIENGQKTYQKDIVINNEVDFIMLKICAIDVKGNAEIELPSLSFNGKNYVKPFDSIYDDGYDVWIGEGFSRTERPHFIVKVNGVCVFDGLKVDGLNHLSGVEFLIPENIIKEKNNSIEIEYGQDNAIDYLISETQLISMPKNFEVLGYSTYQNVGKEFGILIYNPTREKMAVSLTKELKLLRQTDLLNSISVLTFEPVLTGKDVKISLCVDNKIKDIEIKKISQKREDNIITGTGDFVYVEQDLKCFYEYLAWYLNNNIGDLLTFRCVYRWGRTAECNLDFWKQAKELLVNLGIYYSLMIDGRELNGVNANPPKTLLESKYFLGEQTHERDGAYSYWTQDINQHDELFYHLLSRKLERNGIYGKHSPVYTKEGIPKIYYADDKATNIKEAFEYFEFNLKQTIEDGASRHTGVTPHFNSFYNAGYNWLGYESLYGNHELVLGALRGMSREIGKSNYGTHTALQWSTVPCDDDKHALRYKLSLNLSYMHGVTEVNTEEGLWTIEQPYVGFDRFSYACIIHRQVQEQFNKYVKTHNREGKPFTKIAMIMGNYDGMTCFSMSNIFGMKGEEWKVNTPEQSWEVLKTFYPQATLGSVYCYVADGGEKNMSQQMKDMFANCPEAYTDMFDYQSLGLFTSTPYGGIDIISAHSKCFNDYEMLFFSGWNSCTHKQLVLLIDYLKQGKTLIMAKAHLYDSIDRKEVFSNNAKVIDDELVSELLSYREKGNLIYFDIDKYPYEYLEDYKKAVKEKATALKDNVICKVENLSYTQYILQDGTRKYYLQNIGWWTDEPAKLEIAICNKNYEIEINGYDLKTMLVNKDNSIAVLQQDLETNISLNNNDLITFGYGEVDLNIFSQNKVTKIREHIKGKKQFLVK